MNYSVQRCVILLPLLLIVTWIDSATAQPNERWGITPGQVEFGRSLPDSMKAVCLRLFKLYAHTEWNLYRPSILEAVGKYSGNYSIHVSADSLDEWQRETGAIRVTVGNQSGILYSWATYPEGRFVIVDSMIYHTIFDPIGSGMTVRAFDLKARKIAWTTRLEEIEVPHSKYRNWGADLFLSGKTIVVSGAEAAEPYIVLLNQQTGQQLAHRIDDWQYPD